MALDIIKEQRMIRTLFYSLIQAAELLVDEKSRKDFSTKVERFIRERSLIEEDTREKKQVVDELLETLGWKNADIKIDKDLGTGKVLLGKNRYIVKEISDLEGTLLVIKALMEGLGYYLLNGPAKAEVVLAFSVGSHYEITLSRKAETMVSGKVTGKSQTEKESDDTLIHTNLTIESIYQPIFGRNIPNVMLFESTWKVITESFVANYSTEADNNLKLAVKNESMVNLSKFIKKITENEKDDEILNVSELIGEFIAKILATKINEPLIGKLQSTLQDRHADSYLIYYDCKLFCANNQFVNRCTFIRGLWLGLLGEIYNIPMKIKEIFHAGKRDRYCMIEIIPDKKE